MKHLLAPCALLALAPLSFAPAGEQLSFGVAKGTKLTKHFELAVELEKKDATIRIGDQDLPPAMVEKIEMKFTFGNVLEVEDEYVEIDGARSKKLARTFRKATKNSTQHVLMPGQKDPVEKQEELESPLVDRSVLFTWNAKDEKYERAFQGEKGEEKWLEKLEQDMDFLSLLPEGELAVDRTWKIDAKDFDALSLPGGKLAFEKKKNELDLDKEMTGEIEAKYTGTREVEGRKLGVIALTAKLATQQESEGGDGPPMKMEITFELEGEYLWDLAAKHLHSFELHGPVGMEMDGGQDIPAEGRSLAMKMHFELAGELKVKGAFRD